MKFHHICVIVSDLDAAIKMWTELFDFHLDSRFVAPDVDVTGEDSNLTNIMEDIWGMKGPKTTVALLSSPGGARLELQEAINPPMRKTPREYLSYFQTGIREIAFEVADIDSWWDKITAAGFETQTKYIWSVGASRTFQFYDHDGHLIQLWQAEDARATW